MKAPLARDSLPRLDRPPGETLSSYATRVLRQAIVDGLLGPGQKIYQEDIAGRLALSRIPVRDALRQLEAEGLVRLTPNSPARVAAFDDDEFFELYLMREQIEPLAVEYSAPNLTDEDLRYLKWLCREFEAGWRDSERVLKVDRDFHLASTRAAGMPRLLRLVEDFWNSSQHFRRVYMNVVTDELHATVLAEHFLLLDALTDRDGARAGRIARDHIRRTRVHLAGRVDSGHAQRVDGYTVP